jgi:hypothetical protein
MKLDKSGSKSTVNLPCFGVFASRFTSRPLFVSAGLNGKECFQNAAAYLKFHNQIHRTGKAIVRRAMAVAEFGREEVIV